MNTYKYEALSKSGVPITGVVRAMDKTDAVIQIKETCDVVTSLKEIVEEEDILEKLHKVKIKDKDLALLCKQFSIILTAGLPIIKTVELVSGQVEDKDLKKILRAVEDDVKSGYGLADSLALRGAEGLPMTFVETVRAGEQSGALDTTFERLSRFYDKKSKTRGKIVSALTYPAFVMVVAVVVIAIIMIFAVPVFTQTFLDLGIELPLPTRMLISMSNFFSNYTWLICIIALVLFLAYKFYKRTEQGRFNIDKFWLRLPIIGRVSLMNASSQFANTFSTMLSAGLPVIKALTITGKTMSNYYLGSGVMDAVAKVESGFDLGSSIKETHRFPDLLVEMINVGAQSGSIESTLNVVGEYYDNEVDTSTTKAVSMIEPIIICVLAVFVVFVLLAVYLPMFSMYGGM